MLNILKTWVVIVVSGWVFPQPCDIVVEDFGKLPVNPEPLLDISNTSININGMVRSIIGY